MPYQTVSGVVVDGDIWSETRVTGSGGGIAMGGMAVGSSSTRSQVTTHAQYWIRTEEGRDVALQMQASDLAIRVGHKVSALVNAHTDPFKLVCGYNWDTGQRTKSVSWLLWAALVIFTVAFTGFAGVVGICTAIDYSGVLGVGIIIAALLLSYCLINSVRKTSGAMREFWAVIDGPVVAVPRSEQPAAA